MKTIAVFAANYPWHEKPDTPIDLDRIIQYLIVHFELEMEMISAQYDPKLLKTGTYHDAWGTPVQMVTKSPREYILISYGPNRKNDNGEFDDIVVALDPIPKAEPDE